MLNPSIHRLGRPAAVASLLLLALVQVAGGAAAQGEEDGYAPNIRQQLVEIRRSMWAGLNVAERERAHALSADYFARFGDAKAKPRQIRAMKRFATVRTGSRAGFDDQRLTMTTVALGGGGMAADISRSVSPKSFYNDERANPKRYWRIQDALLKGGTVEVGDPVAGPEVLVPAPDAHSTESEPAAGSE